MLVLKKIIINFYLFNYLFYNFLKILNILSEIFIWLHKFLFVSQLNLWKNGQNIFKNGYNIIKFLNRIILLVKN